MPFTVYKQEHLKEGDQPHPVDLVNSPLPVKCEVVEDSRFLRYCDCVHDFLSVQQGS